MRNLYWKCDNVTKNLVPANFESELSFENYVFRNQDLLGDIIILYRQIRTGARQGIPDMLGVDHDANICIIEMKNTQVSEDILPQVLGYAMWAETNPDSIKAIWLESKNKPDDIQIDWDTINVRIIIIAPSFRQNVQKMAAKINYPVDLIEIQRFTSYENEFIIVETLEDAVSQRIVTTKPQQDWTWGYYENNHGVEPTQEFKNLVFALESFVRKNQWNIPYNLNKYYTGFKFGSRVVFDVYWSSTSTWHLDIKLTKKEAESFVGQNWEYIRYDTSFKNAVFKTKSGKFESIRELEELLTKAYKRISGSNK